MIMNTPLSGSFRLVVKRGEELVKDTGEFSNVITNQGLVRIHEIGSGGMNACQVGSGNKTPSATDVGLEVWRAGVSGSRVGDPVEIAPVRRSGRRMMYTFGPGVASGNLSEVGVGWNTGHPPGTLNGLFSRTLIKDSAGNPTTITVLPDETLYVYYTIWTYALTEDVVGTVEVNGATHNVRIRQVAQASPYGAPPHAGMDSFYATLSQGSLVGMDQVPPSGAGTTYRTLPYVQGSNRLLREFTAGLNTANRPDNRTLIISGWSSESNYPTYQIEFDPPISKTSSEVLSFVVALQMVRYDP